MCAYHPIADLPIIQIWETQQNSAFLAVAFHHWQQAIYPNLSPFRSYALLQSLALGQWLPWPSLHTPGAPTIFLFSPAGHGAGDQI
jgi:hypothetical protein